MAVEDLNLRAIKSLMGLPYYAIGKHLCGPAIGDYWWMFNTSIHVDLVDAVIKFTF